MVRGRRDEARLWRLEDRCVPWRRLSISITRSATVRASDLNTTYVDEARDFDGDADPGRDAKRSGKTLPAEVVQNLRAFDRGGDKAENKKGGAEECEL